MVFQVGNIWTKVVGVDEGQVAKLYSFLSFPSARARYTDSFRMGYWDGMVRLFHLSLHRFPSGVYFWKRDAFHTLFPDLTVQDLRVKPKVDTSRMNNLNLRDYQREAVQEVLTKERGILWMPTGSGKTEIAIEVCSHIDGKKLFLVHRKDLLHQTWERFRKYGYDAGRLGGGLKEVNHEVVVSTIQTFSKVNNPELYKGWSAVFLDECHLAPADVFYKTAMKIDAYFRIGMSGTPLSRGDDRNVLLFCVTGPVLYRVKVQELASEGYVVIPRVVFHRYGYATTPLAKAVSLDQQELQKVWMDEYISQIVRNPVRNKLICRLALQTEKPCLIFVRLLEHGKILQQVFRSVGVEVPFVFGATLQETRNQFRRLMAKGKIDILIASVIFEEGIDIPNLRSIIVACGGKSGIKTIQRVGRGMRPDEGKYEVIVHDFIDTGRWTSKHTRERKKLYLLEGYRVEEAD